MPNIDKYANRVTLARLLDDETVQRMAERIPTSTDTVREGVLDHTRFVMEAQVVSFIPTLVERNIKESIQSP